MFHFYSVGYHRFSFRHLAFVMDVSSYYLLLYTLKLKFFYQFMKIYIFHVKISSQEGLTYQEKLNKNASFIHNITENVLQQNISKNIFYFDQNYEMIDESGPGPYLPSWMISPIVSHQHINENLLRSEIVEHNAEECLEHNEVIFGSFEHPDSGSMIIDDEESSHSQATSFFATLLSLRAGRDVAYESDPVARLYIPGTFTETLNNIAS
jgi:hypothetical protein